MKITVQKGTERAALEAKPGQTLLELLRGEDIPVHAPCGGKGTCLKCTVYRVEQGGETPVLACRTPVEEGMVIRLPERAEVVVLAHGADSPLPSEGEREGYGIACDIGTTTVVCHLVQLSDGAVLATVGEGNAQAPYGADVIARIQAWGEGHGAALTRAIREQLSRMILSLCGEGGIGAGDIVEMTVAANTTLCHLLTGLSPEGIGVAPFTPLSLFGDVWAGEELDLPIRCPVCISPCVSGYVGGDITADLLAVENTAGEGPLLLLDVGTNGEMALIIKDRILCCATAAGPAFEGAQIRRGMTAAPGAVSRVEWKDNAPVCTVLGGGEAVGICGSGLIDAVAMLLELGVLEESGRLLDPEEDEEDIPEEALPYLVCVEEEPAFRLTGDVVITQRDIRQLQLGKGAIAAGIRVLLEKSGIEPRAVGRVLLAGGFGSFLRPESAAAIGLIPRELLPVTRPAGNAAAAGARMALVSRGARRRLEELAEGMEYLELSGLEAFNRAYVEEMLFPEG